MALGVPILKHFRVSIYPISQLTCLVQLLRFHVLKPTLTSLSEMMYMLQIICINSSDMFSKKFSYNAQMVTVFPRI